MAATGADLNVKFHMEARTYEMAFGSLDLFFGGLEGIIGPPQMVLGSLMNSMAADHCSNKDSTIFFTSSNGVSTFSEQEWKLCARARSDRTRVGVREGGDMGGDTRTARARGGGGSPADGAGGGTWEGGRCAHGTNGARGCSARLEVHNAPHAHGPLSTAYHAVLLTARLRCRGALRSVVRPDEERIYPERKAFRRKVDGEETEIHPDKCRRSRPVEGLEEQMRTDINARLSAAGHVALVSEEAIAGRLYTGPMCACARVRRRALGAEWQAVWQVTVVAARWQRQRPCMCALRARRAGVAKGAGRAQEMPS